MKIDKKYIVSFLKENKELLKQKFDVDEIKLFGSYARNEQTEESDIDLLVKFGQPSYDKLFELKIWLDKKLGNNCDIVRFRKNMRPKFFKRIRKDLLNA